MNRPRNRAWVFFLSVLLLLILSCPASAASPAAGWRETYDLAMRWVNFVILAVVIVKFGRSPLKQFISGQKEKVIREITRKEEEKNAAAQRLDQILSEIKHSEARFEDLKARIIDQGEKRKQEIIDDARLQSRLMLEDTQRRIQHQIFQAQQKVKAGLVDAAIEMAMERLPRVVTEADNQKFVDRFLAAADSAS